MSSQTDLVRSVLEELEILAAGQSVAAEDEDIILRALPSKVAELNARNVCYIGDTDDIPDEYFRPLVKIMANEVSGAFGVSAQKKQILIAEGGKGGDAEQTLKDVVRLRGTRQMLKPDRFWGNRRGWSW